MVYVQVEAVVLRKRSSSANWPMWGSGKAAGAAGRSTIGTSCGEFLKKRMRA